MSKLKIKKNTFLHDVLSERRITDMSKSKKNTITSYNETSIVTLKAKSIEVNGSDVETYLNYLTTYLNEVNEKNEELKKKLDEAYYRRGVSY